MENFSQTKEKKSENFFKLNKESENYKKFLIEIENFNEEAEESEENFLERIVHFYFQFEIEDIGKGKLLEILKKEDEVKKFLNKELNKKEEEREKEIDNFFLSENKSYKKQENNKKKLNLEKILEQAKKNILLKKEIEEIKKIKENEYIENIATFIKNTFRDKISNLLQYAILKKEKSIFKIDNDYPNTEQNKKDEELLKLFKESKKVLSENKEISPRVKSYLMSIYISLILNLYFKKKSFLKYFKKDILNQIKNKVFSI